MPRALGKVVGPLCPSSLRTPFPRPRPTPPTTRRLACSARAFGVGPQKGRPRLLPALRGLGGSGSPVDGGQSLPLRVGSFVVGSRPPGGARGRATGPGHAPRGVPLGRGPLGSQRGPARLKEQSPLAQEGGQRGLALKTTLVSGEAVKRLGDLGSGPSGGPS